MAVNKLFFEMLVSKIILSLYLKVTASIRFDAHVNVGERSDRYASSKLVFSNSQINCQTNGSVRLI